MDLKTSSLQVSLPFKKAQLEGALVGILMLAIAFQVAGISDVRAAIGAQEYASDVEAVSEAVSQAHSSEVGRSGNVLIDLEGLRTVEKKLHFNAHLIKVLGLDKLLARGTVLVDSDDQNVSFDDLLKQKLQRLGTQQDSELVSATDDSTALSGSDEVGDEIGDKAGAEAGNEAAAPLERTAEEGDGVQDTWGVDVETSSEVAASSETEAQEAMPPYKAQLYDTGILDINDTYVEYVDSFLAAEAPEEGAALWAGSDAVEDGFLGYFIGHNPGDFTPVLSLTIGDPITVYDRFGDERIYYVVDTFIVPNTSRFIDIEERLYGYGESIALQTCLDDNENFLVVVAA